MEKRIRVSTQGRITIPKLIREAMKIQEGQPIIIKSIDGKREIVIELMSTMNDFTPA